MKFKTFNTLINVAVELYKVTREKEEGLEKVFGKDSTIIITDYGLIIDKITGALTKELKDIDTDWIDYLVYENMINDDYDSKKKRIEINGVKYPVTTKVIWKILKGKI